MKKIVIVGSMSFYRKMLEIAERLRKKGHKVILPPSLQVWGKRIDDLNLSSEERKELKRTFERYFLREIEDSDAILVVNLEKNGIKGYIGPNTFFEIMYAWYKGKEIYFLNEIDENSVFKKEIEKYIEYKVVGEELKGL